MDIRRQVGLTVQRYRRERGLSQEALAFEAGIHRTYVSGVERGIRNITLTVVAKFAAALKVLPHQLLEPLPGETGQAAEAELSPSRPASRSRNAEQEGRERAVVRGPSKADRRLKAHQRD